MTVFLFLEKWYLTNFILKRIWQQFHVNIRWCNFKRHKHTYLIILRKFLIEFVNNLIKIIDY